MTDDKTEEALNLHKEVSRWAGELTLAIGEGEFRRGIAAMIMTLRKQAYDIGYHDGKMAAKRGRK